MSYTMAKITEFQKIFKEESRTSVTFLKEVQGRLESSLPKCSQRAAKEVEKLTRQCQKLFQLNKLKYGRSTESLNKATVIFKHRSTSIKPNVSMHHEKLMKSNAKSCQKKKSSSLRNTTMIVLRGGQILAVNKNSNKKCAHAASKIEKRKVADDCKIEKKVSKKRKRIDEINQPTEGVTHSTELICEKKMKIEKKKITVAEYLARKRLENEKKICPVNENSMKRKRKLSEGHESSAAKSCSKSLARKLDALGVSAPKKAKLNAA